jgi:hypothetical protein
MQGHLHHFVHYNAILVRKAVKWERIAAHENAQRQSADTFLLSRYGDWLNP